MTAERRRTQRTIRVPNLARVEGEGSLVVTVREGRVDEARLDIFEPPRYFEGLLRGRGMHEPPDITARICGICPVAYQMSSCQAIEAACGVEVGGALRDLRRLLYCGEWIQSHALHVTLLHAPDFLGYESGLHLAKDEPERVAAGLELKKHGNALMELVGGRAVHPVNVRLGGFYRVPTIAELRAFRPTLDRALELAVELTRWVATLPMPEQELALELVALRHPDEYGMLSGRLVSDRGLDLAPDAYEDAFEEEQRPNSHALYSRIRGRPEGEAGFLVGPLARFSLNAEQLAPVALELAHEVGLAPPVRNPFRSIVVRAVEIVHACAEALELIDRYALPADAALPVPPREGRGCGWTEAPRGMLYHRYDLAADGTIEACTIVPPTAQNQQAIEDDLTGFVGRNLDLPKDELQWRCEQAVRNYDPCISCATHFLRLEVRDP